MLGAGAGVCCWLCWCGCGVLVPAPYGDAGTVKRGGMLEKNNVKVEYTFTEILGAQKGLA